MAGVAAMGGSSGGKGGGGGYSNQTAATATGTANGMFNDSGFVVNFKSSGNAAASTGSMPLSGPLYAALAVAAVLWFGRKK